MKRIVLTILAITGLYFLQAQTSKTEISQLGIFNSTDNSQAKIYFNQDNLLKEILLAKTNTEKEYNVWRVQIYLGSGKDSRNIATGTRNNFRTRYPEVNAELIYHSPYFKVQVGNFKSRIDAESLKRKIIGDYPKCWVVSEIYKI